MYQALEYNVELKMAVWTTTRWRRWLSASVPALIVGGASATRANGIAPACVAWLMKSGAILWSIWPIPAGLIAAGLLDNPVKYAPHS